MIDKKIKKKLKDKQNKYNKEKLPGSNYMTDYMTIT